VRTALVDAHGGTARVRVGLSEAARLMGKVVYAAGVAQEVLARGRGPRDVQRAIAAARDGVSGFRYDAQDAVAALSGLQRYVEGLPTAIGQIREVEGLARRADADLAPSSVRLSTIAVHRAMSVSLRSFGERASDASTTLFLTGTGETPTHSLGCLARPSRRRWRPA
jgi:hypothetical protein